jgi:hypothetical protein
MSRNYTLADVTTVLRAADDGYHDGIDAIVDIRPQPTHRAWAAELLVQLTPPDHNPTRARAAGARRFRVTITLDPTGDEHHPQAPSRPAAIRFADPLDGCTDHTVAAVRAELVLPGSHGGWAPPARQLLAVLLQAAALAGRDLDTVRAWAGDLTPAVVGQVDAILTGHTPTGAGEDTDDALADQRAVLLAHRSAHARFQDSVTATITAALTDTTGPGAVRGAR